MQSEKVKNLLVGAGRNTNREFTGDMTDQRAGDWHSSLEQTPVSPLPPCHKHYVFTETLAVPLQRSRQLLRSDHCARWH